MQIYTLVFWLRDHNINGIRYKITSQYFHAKALPQWYGDWENSIRLMIQFLFGAEINFFE